MKRPRADRDAVVGWGGGRHRKKGVRKRGRKKGMRKKKKNCCFSCIYMSVWTVSCSYTLHIFACEYQRGLLCKLCSKLLALDLKLKTHCFFWNFSVESVELDFPGSQCQSSDESPSAERSLYIWPGLASVPKGESTVFPITFCEHID